MGLHRAFPEAEIIGVDTKDCSKRYPFKFVQADAMTYPLDGFDFIWASPPCQRFSTMFSLPKHRLDHLDLIDDTRQRLVASGVAYVIENVPGAPLQANLTLCGSMFGLASAPDRYLRRHRKFECSFMPTQLKCAHNGRLAVGVYGHGSAGHLGQRMRTANAAEAKVLLDIDWMTRDGMSQSIPPAYSEYIGKEFIKWHQ